MLKGILHKISLKKGTLITSALLALGMTVVSVVTSTGNNPSTEAHAVKLNTDKRSTAPRIITFGDSITYGWDGSKRVVNPYPKVIARNLGTPVANVGRVGAQLTSSNAINKGNTLQGEVSMHYNELKGYQVAMVFFGINDYHHSNASLHQVQRSMEYQLKRIKRANPKIKVYGVLPMTSYRITKVSSGYLYRDESKLSGKAGYTLNQLKTMERKVYDKYHMPVMHKFPKQPSPKYLGDTRLHPNQKYYRYMGNRLTSFIKANWKRSTRIANEIRVPLSKLYYI